MNALATRRWKKKPGLSALLVCFRVFTALVSQCCRTSSLSSLHADFIRSVRALRDCRPALLTSGQRTDPVLRAFKPSAPGSPHCVFVCQRGDGCVSDAHECLHILSLSENHKSPVTLVWNCKGNYLMLLQFVCIFSCKMASYFTVFYFFRHFQARIRFSLIKLLHQMLCLILSLFVFSSVLGSDISWFNSGNLI